jgi:DNA (cytosine-5)-methyltransferase 1
MKAENGMTATPVETIVSAPLSFGSLFAGIGGFDLGFERAGMVCKWQVEIDDYANRVLAKHWPNVHRERDIRECGKHNLEPVDVICGGFPCQDISYAGLGAGLDGERSGLFFEAIRLVRELRPRIVVLENVAALLTRGLDRVQGTLAEIGFDAEWHCIPAAAVGAPHIRDRVFVLAYSRHWGIDQRAWGPRSEQKPKTSVGKQFGGNGENWDVADTTNNRIGRREQQPESCEEARDVANSNESGMEGWAEARNIGGGRKNTEQLVMRFGEQCRGDHWATEPDVGRVANGVPKRVDRLRGLGNAVVPQVAEWIGRTIVEAAGRTPAMCSDAARQDAGDWSH